MTARKLNPFIRKQIPSPAIAIKIPAMEGPINLAPLNMNELRAIAFPRSFSVSHNLHYEGMPDGYVEGVHASEKYAEHDDMPYEYRIGESEYCQQEGLDHGECLNEDEEAAPVKTISEDPGKGREEKCGDLTGKADETEGKMGSR